MSSDEEHEIREDLRTRLAGMTQTEMIDYLLQKSHFRSDKKVVDYVNNKMREYGYPLIMSDKILHRNKYVRRKNNYRWFATRHYEYPIFANHFHSFQIDIIDQSKEYNVPLPELTAEEKIMNNKHDQKILLAQKIEGSNPVEFIDSEHPEPGRKDHTVPPYIYVFQNVNTKYVRAVAMWHKSGLSTLKALELIWRDTHHKLVSIVSDKEKAIRSRLVKDWLHDHMVSLKLIRGDRHSALGVINRMIRTLRDMNTVEEKSKHQSHHKKYRDFSIYRIAKLIHTYNHTKHDTTHRIPAEADRDQKWEENWIIKKLYETEQRKRLSDYELERGDFVRYIIPKDPLQKRRYSLSPEKYKVRRHKGHAYIIMAQDGEELTVPRWRLKKCTPEEEHQHPWAETVPKSMRPDEHDSSEEPRRPRTARSGSEGSTRARTARSGSEPFEQEDPLVDKRDNYFLQMFDDGHQEGDGLILPSAGNFILSPANPTIEGDFDWVNGRLFIPLYTQLDIWILIVVSLKDGVARPRFFCPQTRPQTLLEGSKKTSEGATAVPGRMPDIRDRLNEYLTRNGASAVEYVRVYPAGLAAPPKHEKKLTFLYIADYLSMLLRNENPPQETHTGVAPKVTISAERLADLRRELM
jgi:hypothetical protein